MYWIYLFWKDEFLTKYKIKNTECAVETMEQIAQVTIRTGFTVKHGLSEQIRTLHKFLDEMYERKINKLFCMRNRRSRFLYFLSRHVKVSLSNYISVTLTTRCYLFCEITKRHRRIVC